VSGVAPGARVMPLRVTKSVVLGFFSTWHLARGIEHAARHGAHVVSISLGTVIPSFRLSRAVGYAKKRGVILVAAAGNCTPFVVIPAAYGDVAAVAASNARREVWPGTSRGGAVDVTAPGESVWRAVVDAQHPTVFDVQRGKGTSFSAPIVAGIAALWLARHGREDLIRRYGADKVPKLFTELLRASATFVPGWDTGRFGSGLANARRVLAAPLPARVESVEAAPALEQEASSLPGGMWEFVRLFENALPVEAAPANENAAASRQQHGRLARTLAALLGVSEAELPARLREVGPETAFHFAVNPGLHRRFAAALAPATEATEDEAGRLEDLRGALAVAGVSGTLRSALP
jgi:serine protease